MQTHRILPGANSWLCLIGPVHPPDVTGRHASSIFPTPFRSGAGIFLEDPGLGGWLGSDFTIPVSAESCPLNLAKQELSTEQHQPEEYHAGASMHLESFLGSTSAVDHANDFGRGLEELQAVLLLAGFALLRSVTPGLWYVAAVATRLDVNLGLHYEEAADLHESGALDQQLEATALVGVYYRLVSSCVGHPFSITDEAITTDLPTLLDYEDRTRSGFATAPETFSGPSYKRVPHHYFLLQLLQWETLHVLQNRQAQRAHASFKKHGHRYLHITLTSWFLQPFVSFQAWR
ncbi:MAG: hypothetical protein Q9201_000534 [Fulgogasparrea decipioides]